MEENPTSEFAIVDLAIKLDHCRPSPEREVAKISKVSSRNWFGMLMLRMMILEYMHVFPCDFPTVQKLCHDVGIPIKQAILLESRKKPS
jgi:hypothetical protein